ncbi:MAG TPA: DEAD/DEAH box helicase, partial [Acidimicrobiales bacterium]|nr:DEAD/DEAH box helicase [Acidimicrobiales bacterium]
MADDVASALSRVVAALPGGGEVRAGQQEMATAVARAILTRRHLVVQAGTGTGKSLGYLIPALLSGEKVVVATATKALQDQLATKDLPLLAEHLGVPVEFAVLKGRSNYLCMQRVRETTGTADGTLDVEDPGQFTRQLQRILAWAATST